MPARERVVWSSEGGRVRQPPAPQEQPAPTAVPSTPGKQTARLRRDRRGRAGKTVTLIEGLSLPPGGLEELARALRHACGTGGTVKDGTIEMQGDLRERLSALLEERGFRVKLVGG